MKKLLSFTFTMLLLISCSSDENTGTTINPPADYEKGILITNEGPFNNGSGTVTFVSEDFSNVQQHIFRTVNGTDLGNIVQSMGFQDDKAYIVVNNSLKIEVVNRYTFESLDSIKTGLNNPRYFLANNTKAYVSNWGDPNDNNDDFVAVVDLITNNVVTTIPVSFGPERMVLNGGKVYVAHQGGYGQNNLISVISGNNVESTITVGEVPNSMVVSGNNLYVLCSGNPLYTGNETVGSLVKIDLATNQVIETSSFGISEHPSGLTIDGTDLYYNLDGRVYKISTTGITLPGTPIVDGFFYALEAHDGKLYATDALDFASDGYLKVIDLTTNQEIQNIQVGLVPGGIYFNE